jgi:hypothetical protein
VQTTTTKMILIHWYNRPAQVLPISVQTLQWLMTQSDSYDCLEEVELVTFVDAAEGGA